MSPVPDALVDVDPSTRLSPDDLATQREAEFLAAALLEAQAAAARVPAGRPGWCSNCGAACMPLAVYCDTDCRQDHEGRLLTLAKQGRSA
ncbi:hypothetical protein RQP53_03620 [Paucibacter sp. APW11]|uniref:Uncharacterized protein n=1 Tax=Roseateles aquae TaxID=3077235 RepID=A0ABU3P7R8_9BURK|nr:hypothetical protein [Paucibacter sp. APW11]MDT8998362.1 hypothetical protein [Paucibacter sp. APW11]